PDRLIGLADLLRPLVEDDAVEDRIPVEPRPFDDAAVGQELGQIAPHRAVVGAVGRAEIDEEDPDLGGFGLGVSGGHGAGDCVHFGFPFRCARRRKGAAEAWLLSRNKKRPGKAPGRAVVRDKSSYLAGSSSSWPTASRSGLRRALASAILVHMAPSP